MIPAANDFKDPAGGPASQPSPRAAGSDSRMSSLHSRLEDLQCYVDKAGGITSVIVRSNLVSADLDVRSALDACYEFLQEAQSLVGLALEDFNSIKRGDQ